MRVLGRRNDGVVLMDIGTKTAYAVDLDGNRYAYMGDVDSSLVQRTPLTEVSKDEVSGVRLAAMRVLEKGDKVELAFVPFQKKEKRPCDDTTELKPGEVCTDGYIEHENPFKDGGNPFAKK